MTDERGQLVGNVSDSRQVREARKQVKRDKATAIEDVKHVMADGRCRRFVWRLLGDYGVYETPFDGRGNDWTNFRCGLQEAGRRLLKSVMDACPEQYAVMQAEAVELANRRVKGKKRADAPPEVVRSQDEDDTEHGDDDK